MNNDRQLILVDAHAHYHACFDSTRFLNAAYDNFAESALLIDRDARKVGYLMLADSSQGGLASLMSHNERTRLQAEWRLEPTDEPTSVAAYRCNQPDYPALVLVAGRQVLTEEGIELLALATAAKFRDRQPFFETLRSILAADAIPVVPWGFGKWAFRRGRLVAGFLDSLGSSAEFEGREIFVGDNGGRLSCLGEPRLLKAARSTGIRILPGSDPLPFASQATRLGSYGFAVSGKFDPDHPLNALKAILAESRSQPEVFGRLTRLDRFVTNQAAIRLHNSFISGTTQHSRGVSEAPPLPKL